MKQKKYLGRRIFALLLALLLSLNTATAYASADMPAAWESGEPVSETSETYVEEESLETAETVETEAEGGGVETTVEKPAGGSEESDLPKGEYGDVNSEEEGPSEESKESGSEGSETEEPKTEAGDGSGDATVEKPAGGSDKTDPTGGEEDVTTEADVSDEETFTEEDVAGEETETEELPEEETAEVPEEVKAFLDAAAALPSVEEITAENAEEIGNQVNTAFALYDVLIDLDPGLEEREDVVAAMEKARSVFAAVLAAQEPDTQAVQMFLDAVAAIVVPEEDLTLEENADLADSYSAAVYKAFALYEALREEQQELEEVVISSMELENMAMVLPDYGVSAYALSDVVVRPDYNPGLCMPGVNRYGGSLQKNVDEKGFYKRRAVHNFYCRSCGWFYGQSSAKEYANIQWEQSNTGIIDNVSFGAGVLEGSQCLEMNFTGAEVGTTLVTMQYDVNFHTRWNSGYASCPNCKANTNVQQYDDNWYHYVDTFYVTVEGGSENKGNIYWAYIPTDGTKYGSAVVGITRPYRDSRFDQYFGKGKQTALLAEIRNPELVDEAGMNGVYADITTEHCGTFGGTGPKYQVNMTITGLDTPTPEGEYVSVYLTYDAYRYDGWYSSNDPFGRLKLVKSSCTDEVRIVVYDPETVALKVNESFTHRYKGNAGYGNYFTFNKEPDSSDPAIVQVSDTANKDYYTVQGLKRSEDKETAVTGSFTRYHHNFFKVFGTNPDKYNLYVPNLNLMPTLTFVDTVKYIVSDAAETPVTIIKEFDGITADQIPDDFELTYSVGGCAEHSNVRGTLKKSDATLTNADGTPRLSWNVDLPVAKHGSAVHTITFSEKNACAAGYKIPTMSGKEIKLEDLKADDGASKPVITVTNRYELGNDVFELFYDFNGGTNGPATQLYVGQSDETSHEFNVAGSEETLKIPTNGEKVFKGWSETLNGDVVYTYNSNMAVYTPAKATVTRNSGENSASKTLYAVWEEYTGPNYRLDSLVKERIKSGDLPNGVTLPAGVTVNDDNTVVFLGDNPASVTLLYKITVNGTAGAEYKVTDSGAEWVSGGAAHSKEGNDLIITGTVGVTSAVIYVTKTFTKEDITDGRLINKAKLESDDPDTEEPGDGTGSDTADAEKKYTVIIHFITDDETPETLQDPSRNEFEEGEGFGFGIVKPEVQKMVLTSAAGTGTVAISVPYTITKNGKTYVLDEAVSKGALDALKAAGENGVTSDMIKDLIYSPDRKGGSDPDKEEGGSDGVPDKYQAKIVYQAKEGGSQNGVSGYVEIRDENGAYSAEGTVDVSAEATADGGYEFDRWTAEAAEHEDWIYAANGNAALNDSITAKGGAVYTFTANFAAESGSEGEPDPIPTPGPEPEPTPATPAPDPGPGPEPIIPGPVPMVGPEPVVPTVTPAAETVTEPAPTAALASPTPEAAALAEEEVPLAGEEEEKRPEALKDEETPLAGGNGASWALINFALMNLAIFESLMLLIGYFIKTKNDKDGEDEKRKLKKKGIFRIISLPIAMISLIVFLLTEDITLPTAFVDKYTVVMLIIAIVQTVMVTLSNKKYEDEEEA